MTAAPPIRRVGRANRVSDRPIWLLQPDRAVSFRSTSPTIHGTLAAIARIAGLRPTGLTASMKLEEWGVRSGPDYGVLGEPVARDGDDTGECKGKT